MLDLQIELGALLDKGLAGMDRGRFETFVILLGENPDQYLLPGTATDSSANRLLFKYYNQRDGLVQLAKVLCQFAPESAVAEQLRTALSRIQQPVRNVVAITPDLRGPRLVDEIEKAVRQHGAQLLDSGRTASTGPAYLLELRSLIDHCGACIAVVGSGLGPDRNPLGKTFVESLCESAAFQAVTVWIVIQEATLRRAEEPQDGGALRKLMRGSGRADTDAVRALLRYVPKEKVVRFRDGLDLMTVLWCLLSTGRPPS